MKAFQGTILALVAVLVLLGAWYATRPEEKAPVKAKDKKEEGVALFVFEKADLVKVEVARPEETVVLAERADGWWIEGENLRASKSMVNRVKHQLHDLVARATVVENPGEASLYGLGSAAIHVTLTFRDGSTRRFDAGDPNPSGVSFYIRPIPGDLIYTVKKSAVDYYSLSLSEFRERRFASFDSKDVDGLEATLPAGKVLKLQRTGDDAWDLLAPAHFPADDSDVRSLLGRVSAMRAIEFVTEVDPVKEPGALATYGLDPAVATITVRFGSRDPLTLELGVPTGKLDGEYTLRYAKLAGEGSIYAVRDGLLEDYSADPSTFRLRRFVRIDNNKVATAVATFLDTGKDADLNGTVTIVHAADAWQWDDGVPVPGSTPDRVASRASSVESEEFVAESAPDAKYGFDQPIVKVVLTDTDGLVRTVLLGKEASPGKRHEGEPYDRYYARVAEFPEVYIVDGGVLDVVKDLMREHRRKATGDTEKEERRDRIEQDRGGQPPPRPGPPRPGAPPATPGAPPAETPAGTGK